MNDHYEMNWAALKLRYPQIVRRIETNTSKVGVKRIETSSGYPTLLVKNENGMEDYLHSSYNPFYEAKDLIGFTKFSRIPRILIFYGMGLGYHLLEYVNRPHPENNFILIIEKEAGIFVEAMKESDLTRLINHPKIFFVVGETLDQLKNMTIDYFLGEGRYYYGNCIDHINLDNAINLFPQYYVDAARQIKEGLENVVLGIGNSTEDAQIGITNVIENRKAICAASYITSLGGSMKGLPGVVVASGPSLARSLPILKDIQSKALVICADSALGLLLKNGIRPAMVSTIERVPLVKPFFELDQDISDIYALVIPVLLKEVMDILPPKRFMAFQGNNTFAWLPLDRERFLFGPSCATLAFMALRIAGCDPIYLFGQDLAYDQKSGSTHAAGLGYHLNLNMKDENTRKIVKVLGNNGESVVTTTVWQFMKRLIEYMVPKGTETVYNAIPIDYGAKIDGVERIDPEVAAEHFKSRTGIDIQGRLANAFCPADEMVVQENVTAIENYLLEFEGLLQSSIEKAKEGLSFFDRVEERKNMFFFNMANERKLLVKQLEAFKRELFGMDRGLSEILIDLFHLADLDIMAPYHQLSYNNPKEIEHKLHILRGWFERYLATCLSCLDFIRVKR